MTTTVIVVLLAAWVLYSGWKFYNQVDWEEPPESTPDLGELHKREAQLLLVQEFLQEARAQGKLSQALLDEYNRFCDKELAQLRTGTTKKVIQ
jgi:hypothetical protein